MTALAAAAHALKSGRAVRLYDDRDPDRPMVEVRGVGASSSGARADGAPTSATRAETSLVLSEALLASLAGRLGLAPAALASIGSDGEGRPEALAAAALEEAGASRLRPEGPLPVRGVGRGGVVALRTLDAGAVDLARVSGLPAAALVRAAPAEGALEDRPLVALTEVAAHREAHEELVREAASSRLPSAYASEGLVARAFVSLHDGTEHLALVRGAPEPGALVRLHSECLTGDALGSLRCDCGEQLRAALARISAARSGALVYLRGHEGRGIGLANKIGAYALQDHGYDTAEANTRLGFPKDGREYAVAAQILKRLGLGEVRLLSNNPRKAQALRAFGVSVAAETPLILQPNPHNRDYLAAKREKLGHRLPPFDGASLALARRR